MSSNINIVDSIFSVGPISDEELYHWRGKICLPTKSDYTKAVLDLSLTSYPTSYLELFACNNKIINYSMNNSNELSLGVLCPMSNPNSYASMSQSILPILYLSKDVPFSGEGTLAQPYTISES